MRRALLLIGLPLLVLSACTQLRERFQMSNQTSSQSMFPETEPQAEEEESATVPQTQTGTVTYVPEERLLPTGFLEIGKADAPHVLFVWTNHSCQYCSEFHTTHLPRLMQDYVATGQLRVQIAILPLQKYSQSRLHSAALHCALRQNKGLAMHEALSSTPPSTLALLLTKANTLGLDLAALRTCLDEAPVQFLLDQQVSIARSLDVVFVPTLFLDGQKTVGLPYYPDLRGEIEKVLKD